MKSSQNGAARAAGSVPATRTRQPRRNPQAPSPAATGNAEDTVRAAAYALYEARGYLDGFALEDWLRAEQQVRLSHGTAGSA